MPGGKGHTQRPVDVDKFNESFDRIFGAKNCEHDYCFCGEYSDHKTAEFQCSKCGHIKLVGNTRNP